MSDTAGRNKAGRKSKAEELGLLAEKDAFLAELEKLDMWTESGLGKLAIMASFGQARGLISISDREALHDACAVALRALRHEKGDTAVTRVEKAVRELRAMREEARVSLAKMRASAH